MIRKTEIFIFVVTRDTIFSIKCGDAEMMVINNEPQAGGAISQENINFINLTK